MKSGARIKFYILWRMTKPLQCFSGVHMNSIIEQEQILKFSANLPGLMRERFVMALKLKRWKYGGLQGQVPKKSTWKYIAKNTDQCQSRQVLTHSLYSGTHTIRNHYRLQTSCGSDWLKKVPYGFLMAEQLNPNDTSLAAMHCVACRRD